MHSDRLPGLGPRKCHSVRVRVKVTVRIRVRIRVRVRVRVRVRARVRIGVRVRVKVREGLGFWLDVGKSSQAKSSLAYSLV